MAKGFQFRIANRRDGEQREIEGIEDAPFLDDDKAGGAGGQDRKQGTADPCEAARYSIS